jgi:hypothetical protein
VEPHLLENKEFCKGIIFITVELNYKRVLKNAQNGEIKNAAC